jgi:hypothetical protein
MPDWKQIGLSGKDVILGVVTVAAGATGGPSGAQGAQQIDKGLDGILGMAGVTAEPKQSRLNPETEDFAVRTTALQKRNPTAQVSQPQPQSPPVFRESVVEPAPRQTQESNQIPPGVRQELAQLGYSDAEVVEIAAGRWRPTSQGQTMSGAVAQRVPQQQGQTLSGAEAKPGSGFEGFNLGGVLGMLKGFGGSGQT